MRRRAVVRDCVAEASADIKVERAWERKGMWRWRYEGFVEGFVIRTRSRAEERNVEDIKVPSSGSKCSRLDKGGLFNSRSMES